MAAAEEAPGALSLAQVEEELQAAEAYLTASDGAPPVQAAATLVASEEDASAAIVRDSPEYSDANNGFEAELPLRDDSIFRRKCKTRPVLSEERRREILAKLSSERQTALRARNAGAATTLIDRGGGGLFQTDTSSPTSDEGKSWTAEERIQRIQKLLEDRNARGDRLDTEPNGGQLDSSALAYSSRENDIEVPAECGRGSDSSLSAAGSLDDDEIYYASDILDNEPASEIRPRSRLELIHEGETEEPTDELEPPQPNSTGTQYARSAHANGVFADQDEGTTSASLFAKLLSHLSDERGGDEELFAPVHPTDTWQSYDEAHLDTSDNEDEPIFVSHQGPQERHEQSVMPAADEMNHQFSGHDSASPYRPTEIDQHRGVTKKSIQRRIDFLAQPRNETFAEREKQRLVLEMENLRECTFRPNTQKSSEQSKPAKTSDAGTPCSTKRPGTKAFPWLTLSPRRTPSARDGERCTNDGFARNENQHVIQRLHLDGTSRYDLREDAREALEAQKLSECTFKPKINATSRNMLSMVDYKPIHHRISDLQRAKAEYVQRIREQLDEEECGPLSFTPTINPKSLEIAATVLAARGVRDSNPISTGKTKAQRVTERLAEDADAMMEKRLATQEYFDVLNEQPFAPKISETSNKIVEQKPEFQMDFVARQHYFQSRDQEKMEALEGFCDVDYARGERLTFKPNIGNADHVLKQLRPDRCAESSQQQLYRLTYNDPKRAELKKQRLRDQQYAQCTFKPEINPVSKALGRSSTLDELAHPTLDVQQDQPTSKRSPPQGRRPVAAASSSRAALKQYFANKRFRSRVALEMEEAEKAECTFQPTLIASRKPVGCASTPKLYSREPRATRSIEWKSENLLHLIEAERQKKADEIEAKRNAQELKELEECTFRPNLRKSGPRKRLPGTKNSPSPPRNADDASRASEDAQAQQPVIVRGLGRFLELRELARKQQAEQKQREEKVFAPNANYEPRSYTVPKPFKLSESSKDSIRRRLKVREEMRAKERTECTFRPQTVASQSRRVLENMLNR